MNLERQCIFISWQFLFEIRSTILTYRQTLSASVVAESMQAALRFDRIKNCVIYNLLY